MWTILAVSQNAFRRALRSKIFATLIIFAVGLILLSKLLEFLTFTAQMKLIKDVGLASISFFTVLMAIFLAGGSICSQIEQKTIYTILSKPVSRLNFMLGEFLGIIWSILVTLTITTAIFLVLLYSKGYRVQEAMIVALVFIFFEATVISSIAIMFSAFSSSSSTGTVFTLLIYLIGHLNSQLHFLGEKIEENISRCIIKIVGWILPNLEYFNVREKAVQNISISANYVGKVSLYAFIYICAMLGIAYLALRKREI